MSTPASVPIKPIFEVFQQISSITISFSNFNEEYTYYSYFLNEDDQKLRCCIGSEKRYTISNIKPNKQHSIKAKYVDKHGTCSVYSDTFRFNITINQQETFHKILSTTLRLPKSKYMCNLLIDGFIRYHFISFITLTTFNQIIPIEINKLCLKFYYSMIDPSLLYTSIDNQLFKIKVGYKTEYAIPTMFIQCTNKTNDIIKGIDIKIRTNYLGIFTKQETLSLSDNIYPKYSETVCVSLELLKEFIETIDTHIIMNLVPLELTIGIGLTMFTTNMNKPSIYVPFHVAIPAKLFFIYCVVSREMYLKHWKSIPQHDNLAITRRTCQNTDKNVVKTIFEENNCYYVAERIIQNRGVSLYFSSMLRDVLMLLEFSIANNGAVRMVVKSKDAYLSAIACRTVIDFVDTKK
eukprot:2363_1